MTTEPSNQGVTAMNNIDRFNEVCAVVFANLYENFPQPIELSGWNLAGAVGFDMNGRTDALKADAETAEFCSAAVQWLVDAGYILAPTKREKAGVFCDARLTAKGLEAMKATPSSVDPSKSVGEHLVDASKEGMKDIGSKLVSEGMTAIGRMIMQSGGLG